MQGSLAQAVALTIYGNAALAIGLDPAGFYPSNSTFKYCQSVTFSENPRAGSKPELASYASDPVAWIKNLQGEGASLLRMNYASSEGRNPVKRMTIEEIRGAKSFRWEGTWRASDSRRADRRIWQVNYCRTAASPFRFAPEPMTRKHRRKSWGAA